MWPELAKYLNIADTFKFYSEVNSIIGTKGLKDNRLSYCILCSLSERGIKAEKYVKFEIILATFVSLLSEFCSKPSCHTDVVIILIFGTKVETLKIRSVLQNNAESFCVVFLCCKTHKHTSQMAAKETQIELIEFQNPAGNITKTFCVLLAL